MKKSLKQGISMIEILLYAVLLTVVLGVVTNFFYQIANFKINHQISSDLFQNSQLIINKLSQDLAAYPNVISPLSEGFEDSLVAGTGSGQITYKVNNGSLQRNDNDLNDDKVIINLAPPNYGFRKIGNSIQVKFQLTTKLKPFGQGVKSQNYQTAIFLGY